MFEGFFIGLQKGMVLRNAALIAVGVGFVPVASGLFFAEELSALGGIELLDNSVDYLFIDSAFSAAFYFASTGI